MRNIVFAPIVFWLFVSFVTQKDFDKTIYYDALSGKSEESIDAQITKLDGEGNPSLLKAYLGAALMKKAEFEKGSGKKLKVFKKGAQLLEDQIRSDPENAEFRFLRLVIQEHAPKILKYNKNLDNDKKVVLTEFDKFEPDLKKIVKNYSVSSGIIKTNKLK